MNIKIYADHAATTALSPAAYEAMLPWLQDKYGNPSTLYSLARDPRKAVTRIENLLYSKQMKGHLDYMLVGHMHTPGMEGGPTTIIRNGSVCGSGDEYTMKKRLFGPPCQVCMVVDAGGVRSIHPVDLT